MVSNIFLDQNLKTAYVFVLRSLKYFVNIPLHLYNSLTQIWTENLQNSLSSDRLDSQRLLITVRSGL